MVVQNKGTIQYAFDAAGVKHRKTISQVENGVPQTVKFDYIGNIVYRNDSLLFFMQPEGRVRALYEGGTIAYVYDYFLSDHLGNTRMVLTEETLSQTYLASMETERAVVENKLFSNVDASRSAVPVGYPVETGSENKALARLNGNDPNRRIGPSLVLKVMAGDTVRLGALAFYKSQAGNSPVPANAPVADMATALVNAFGNPGAMIAESHSSPTSSAAQQSGRGLPGNSMNRLRNTEPENAANEARPRAYLNFVVFDEQFNLVESNSGVKQVTARPDEVQTLAQDEMVIDKSGFLYVYTSNESSQDVFFDNVTVALATGPVLEETHYYPFGLTMAGISIEAAGKLANRVQFNGKELQHQEFGAEGLEWYDYGARMYDPQIGRWHAVDPLAEKYSPYSPYNFAVNNPVYYYDEDGRFLGTFIGGLVGGIVGGVRAAIKGENVGRGFGRGMVAGMVAGAIVDITVATGGTGTVALLAGGALSGMGGNAVDQFFNIKDGKQKSFNWGESAVSGVIGAGLSYGGSLIIGKLAPVFSKVFGRNTRGQNQMLSWRSPQMGNPNLDEVVPVTGSTPVAAPVPAAPPAPAFQGTYKTFSKSNYRHNLQVSTGQTGVGMDAHHIFPQAARFQQHWNRVGLNINHPSNMAWWASGPHRQAAAAYNKEWDRYFFRKPQASLQEIQNYGHFLRTKYAF